jgi:hypothetical protein
VVAGLTQRGALLQQARRVAPLTHRIMAAEYWKRVSGRGWDGSDCWQRRRQGQQQCKKPCRDDEVQSSVTKWLGRGGNSRTHGGGCCSGGVTARARRHSIVCASQVFRTQQQQHRWAGRRTRELSDAKRRTRRCQQRQQRVLEVLGIGMR